MLAPGEIYDKESDEGRAAVEASYGRWEDEAAAGGAILGILVPSEGNAMGNGGAINYIRTRWKRWRLERRRRHRRVI